MAEGDYARKRSQSGDQEGEPKTEVFGTPVRAAWRPPGGFSVRSRQRGYWPTLAKSVTGWQRDSWVELLGKEWGKDRASQLKKWKSLGTGVRLKFLFGGGLCLQRNNRRIHEGACDLWSNRGRGEGTKAKSAKRTICRRAENRCF